ncbi:HypC/HybG/HupF family hydrogenase formation chaperone [Anaerosacchariphilus polymeriproducens]|uniref:HypC/HybG/HupF family hydrogenase formation chaperone n=1 Tax=Anaerosacchariphilus polymeriproducens TaxID=1812858 RepID=A0A371ATS3_9FIRM|nr:HypC/HybG/HupF family hydrogenase formation chaperone [Anaerosacchariphilus polymeriproducens]RDU22966.1 HypC/HybG/HupF family hydrogenase formation chaperone [Anaerosacchariphilus polymeriproducens]
MCVALPGKVIKTNGNLATVDFNGNIIQAQAGLVEVNEGDFCLVHAGCILQKLNQEEAVDMLELFQELEDLQR